MAFMAPAVWSPAVILLPSPVETRCPGLHMFA